MKNITESFTLVGFFIATDWYGHEGWKRFEIKTDINGLEKIKKNPLQDYINFGFQSVDYTEFKVYKTETEDKKDVVVIKEYKNPILTIEEGKFDLSEEDQELLMSDGDIAVINYE